MDEEKTTLELQSEKIREKFLVPLTDNKNLEGRHYDSKEDRKRPDGEFQRDYTRVLYSSSFRRLQGKMQLYALENDQFMRNRLTHSLEVAQIARSIATAIGYNQQEMYVVEAGALAHDIGNPPFGHAGEKFLNELCKEFGGFEGNAQTFRILTTVEQKRHSYQGLNLTNRTLLGILKYYNPYQIIQNSELKYKKFLYNDDYNFVSEMINDTGVELRTLDVQIVDIADEIAYAAHDLEDGLRLGVFTVEEILHEFSTKIKSEESINKFDEIVGKSKEKAGFKKIGVDSAEFSKLYRKEITSQVINTLINDIGIVPLSEKEKSIRGTEHDEEIGFVKYRELASGLKKTIFDCVTNKDTVYKYEAEGIKMLEALFHFFEKNTQYLPSEYRVSNIVRQYKPRYDTINEVDLQKRLIIDYISGMMDEYVKTVYEKFIKNSYNIKGFIYE